MSLKNHYQTLRLPPTASPDDIKKAFRKLAHQFHPDKNRGSSSEVMFREIQEAYSILSDKGKKKLYDEERYFWGLSSRKEPMSISGDWILKLSLELRRHCSYLHRSDMNHKALHDYVMLILSDLHLAVLENENRDEIKLEIAENILEAVTRIDYLYYEKIISRLSLLNLKSDALRERLSRGMGFKRNEQSSEKLLPWIVLLTVMILCIAMYLYSRR